MGKCENVIYLGSHTLQHTQNTAGIAAFERRALHLWPNNGDWHLAFGAERIGGPRGVGMASFAGSSDLKSPHLCYPEEHREQIKFFLFIISFYTHNSI